MGVNIGECAYVVQKVLDSEIVVLFSSGACNHFTKCVKTVGY